jgi:TolB-like protein
MVRQSAEVETHASTPKRSYLRYAAGVAVLAVAIPIGLWWQSSSAPTGSGAVVPVRSIAVLPLQNLSRDPEQEFFSDGMTEALITSLAQLNSIDVISRTSVMRFKGTTKSVPEIGRELGVDAIVEGSVQRAGGRVRISAQLVRATTATNLWARDFDRDATDVLGLQADVARAIAQEIRLEAFDQRVGFVRWANVDPAFDGVRSDPRFEALVSRLHLPQTSGLARP